LLLQTELVKSLQNAGIHGQLQNLVVVLGHDLFDCCWVFALHRHIAVLQQELVQDVAVVRVHWQNLVQAREDLFLSVQVGVDPGSKFLREVDSLVDSDLSSFLLIFFEKH